MVEAGFTVFDRDPGVLRWAQAASDAVRNIDLSPDRCGGTWHVGVDALPNALDGSIGGVPLEGPWQVERLDLHPAQVSVIYPEYPRQDEDEPDTAYQYRIKRCAAHTDGLLPEGPQKRRHLREPHAYVLGLPLGDVSDSPLVVWEGSHKIMGEAFADALTGVAPEDWGEVDLTDVYQAARRDVFEKCRMEFISAVKGQAMLLHRHLIHGVAPWNSSRQVPRIVAYFRPQFVDLGRWL